MYILCTCNHPLPSLLPSLSLSLPLSHTHTPAPPPPPTHTHQASFLSYDQSGSLPHHSLMKDWRRLGQVLTTVLATGGFIQGADHQGTLQTLSMKVRESEVAQSCPTLCNSMDCSLPGSSVHGIFQARILEWVAISFSRRSSRSRD